MKVQAMLLLSACLLFGATLADAAPAPPASPPLAVTPPDSAPTEESPFCVASLFQQEGLPSTPSPSPKAGGCGPCSSSGCQGLNINASCYYLTRTGYAIGKCHADSVCSTPEFSAYCSCRTGPEV